MKKIILFLVFSLVAANQLWALDVGPEAPSRGKFSLAIEGNIITLPLKLRANPTYWREETVYVPSTGETTVTTRDGDYFDEVYTSYGSTNTYKRNWEDIKNKSNFLLLKVCYVILDRLDVYGKLGIGDEKIVYTEYIDYYCVSAPDDWERSNSKQYIENNNFHTGFVWSLGLKGRLYESANGVKVGADVQYLGLKNELKFSDYEDREEDSDIDVIFTSKESQKFETSLTQWQIAFTICQQIKQFLPYVGVEYIDPKIKWDYTNEVENRVYDRVTGAFIHSDKVIQKRHAEFKPNKSWNGILGVRYLIKEYACLNLEGKFFGELSFGTSANIKF